MFLSFALRFRRFACKSVLCLIPPCLIHKQPTYWSWWSLCRHDLSFTGYVLRPGIDNVSGPERSRILGSKCPVSGTMMPHRSGEEGQQWLPVVFSTSLWSRLTQRWQGPLSLPFKCARLSQIAIQVQGWVRSMLKQWSLDRWGWTVAGQIWAVLFSTSWKWYWISKTISQLLCVPMNTAW